MNCRVQNMGADVLMTVAHFEKLFTTIKAATLCAAFTLNFIQSLGEFKPVVFYRIGVF